MTTFQFVTSYTEENRSRFKKVVLTALEAGCPSIQFAWEGTDKEILEKAKWLRIVTLAYGADLIINNRVDIATVVNADAVHLGQNDIPFDIAREYLPAYIKIGLTLDSLDTYRHPDADYYGVGPVFKTTTKYQDRDLWGLDNLNTLRSLTDKQLVVIGGIKEENISEVLTAGADGVAIIGDIYRSDSITNKVQNIIGEINEISILQSRL